MPVIDSGDLYADLSLHRERYAITYDVQWQTIRITFPRMNDREAIDVIRATGSAYMKAHTSMLDRFLRTYRVYNYLNSVPKFSAKLSYADLNHFENWREEVRYLFYAHDDYGLRLRDVMWDWNKVRIELNQLVISQPDVFAQILRSIWPRSKRKELKPEFNYFVMLHNRAHHANHATSQS